MQHNKYFLIWETLYANINSIFNFLENMKQTFCKRLIKETGENIFLSFCVYKKMRSKKLCVE